MGVLLDASVCVLADLGGIAMRSHSHEIETLVPGSLIEISRFDDSGLSSLFTIHGYSPEGVNLEELRGELQDFVTTVPKYSIPEMSYANGLRLREGSLRSYDGPDGISMRDSSRHMHQC